MSHPISGVGFRTHEAALKINSSAHNGYLALLAEIGVIGFAAVLYVTISGLWNIWRRIQYPSQTFSYSVLLGLASGYFVLAMFERYFINTGNPTSLLFLISILGLPPSEDLELDYGEEETQEFVSGSADADLYDARVRT
jgi:O-antigen ligase